MNGGLESEIFGKVWNVDGKIRTITDKIVTESGLRGRFWNVDGKIQMVTGRVVTSKHRHI